MASGWILPPGKSCHSRGACGPRCFSAQSGQALPTSALFLQSSHIDQRTKPNTALEFSLEADRGRGGGLDRGDLGSSSPHLVHLGGGVGLQLRHQDPHDVEQEHKVDLDDNNNNLDYRYIGYRKIAAFDG